MKFDNKYIRGLAYDLTYAKNPTDVLKAWDEVKEHYHGHKAITTLEEYKEFSLPAALSQAWDNNQCFVPYFLSNKFYFLDNGSMLSMLINKTNNIGIDYSITFDTNYASYIERFVNFISMGGETIEVQDSIDVLLRNNFNYDYNFYLFENIKKMGYDFVYTTDIIKVDEGIIQNVAALERFKSIDIEEYTKSGSVVYLLSNEDAWNEACELVHYFYNNIEGRVYLQKIVNLQKKIKFAIVGMLLIHHSSKRGARRKMEEYFDFINYISGIYLDRESVVAYELFDKNPLTSIFNVIGRNIPPNDLDRRIDNIAWDFMIPRIMEEQMATCGEGDYMLQFLITEDEGLRNIFNIFPMKGCIFEEKTLKLMPLPKVNSASFFNERKCDSFFQAERAEERKKIVNDHQNNGFIAIDTYIDMLAKVLFGGS